MLTLIIKNSGSDPTNWPIISYNWKNLFIRIIPIDYIFMWQYEARLQEDERKFLQYRDIIKEVSRENEQLRRLHTQAVNMVREIETKLNFSQGGHCISFFCSFTKHACHCKIAIGHLCSGIYFARGRNRNSFHPFLFNVISDV